MIEFLSSYLRVVGEDKVENIPKRIKFFSYFLEKLDKKSILKAWREAVIVIFILYLVDKFCQYRGAIRSCSFFRDSYNDGGKRDAKLEIILYSF